MADFTSNWPFFRANHCCTYDFLVAPSGVVAHEIRWPSLRSATPEFHEPAINQQISQIQPNSVALMS